MGRLENKVAVVTGGTSGIGLATVRDFLSEGAKVFFTGRNQETVDEIALTLGPNAFGLVCEVGKWMDIQLMAQKVKAISPHVDIVFHNAGYGKFLPLEAIKEVHIDELFDVLVKGTLFTVQALLPLMGEGGSIVLNSSVVTQYGTQYASLYSAAKSAVSSFVKTFAAECTAKGIRVNGISPGYTETKGFEKTGMTPEQMEATIQAVTKTLPFKRFAKATEVAKAVTFLASDEASYIHATELVVDGGYTVIK